MHTPPRRQAAIFLLLSFAVLCLGAALASGLAGSYWALELPGHFRAQLSIAVAFLSLGLALLRAWRSFAVSGLCAVVVAGPVLALWVPSDVIGDRQVILRVLSLNVSFYDRNHDEVVELIQRHNPDIVGLVEVNDRWVDELSVLDPTYPYRALETTSRSGVALLSRLPLDSAKIRPFATTRRRFAVADLRVEGHPLTLVVVHAASPVGRARVALRNAQLDLLAEIGQASLDRQVIVMGDFNTSPWSAAFRQLMAQTGWRNAANGFGYRATWPTENWWLGIPIDHHIVSDGIVVHDFDILGPTGSDHFAVYSELGFR